MATYAKRGKTWRAEVRKKGYTPQSQSGFNTKAEAVAWATAKEADIYASVKGIIPNKIFKELLQKYHDEVSPSKRGGDQEQQRLKRMMEDPIALVNLRDLDETDVSAWKARRSKLVGPASVRREWGIFSPACQIAVDEWKWLKVNPFKKVKRPKSTPHRTARYSPDQVQRILTALEYSLDGATVSVAQRVGAIFLFALQTGMRLKEMTRLTWDRVFLDSHYIHVDDDSKTLRRDVPTWPEAERILRQMLRVKSDSDQRVFQLNESQVDANFRKYRAFAMVEGLTFHDTKHTACTMMVREMKIDIFDLARIVGTRDPRTLLIYFNPTAEEIARDYSYKTPPAAEAA